MKKIGKVEQADAKGGRADGYHKHLKKRKAKLERLRAKRDPESPPAYNKYYGYET